MERYPAGDENKKGNGDGDRPRVQRFQFGPWLFDVGKAQTLIAEIPRATKRLPVWPWARFYGLDGTDGSSFSFFSPHAGFDRDYAMTTDLSDPILIATLRNREGEEFPLLIDGTHRLYHANAEGLGELPAYVLTVEESLTIREDAFLGSTVHLPKDDRERLAEGEEEHGNGRS